MRIKPGSFLFLAILLLASLATVAAETVEVVDGDTLKVGLGDRIETVRLIGVDTPETVHPQKPVEYFGKEASTFARRMALGQTVRLEDDPECSNRDKYGRLLRYVYLSDGKLLNGEIIAQGYGHAYTRYPFSKMEEFRQLERQAREESRGLWGDEGEPSPTERETKVGASVAKAPKNTQTVYVTRTGGEYHRAGCRYLANSSIPMKLSAASRSYYPCSVCSPPRLKRK